MIYAPLVVFLGGAVYEAAAVAWVHYAERKSPTKAALFAMICATALVVGIGESVKDFWMAPYFIVGKGAGTFCAVYWNKAKET